MTKPDLMAELAWVVRLMDGAGKVDLFEYDDGTKAITGPRQQLPHWVLQQSSSAPTTPS